MRLRPNEPEVLPRALEAIGKPGLRSTKDSPKAGQWPRLIGLGLMLLLLVSLGCWVLSSWIFARALSQARRLMDADHFPEARAAAGARAVTVVK